MIMALPAIFSAISGIADLVSGGKQVYDEITGKSAPDDPAGLRAAVEDMTPEQQAQWAEAMTGKIEMYRAQTERLEVQGGRINSETLAMFSQKVRDYIGKMRMVTRPLVVRRMTHVILLPVYVVTFDIFATLANWGIVVWSTSEVPHQIPLLAEKFFGPDTIYVQLYTPTITPAAAIVITYMTLREVGKAGGPKAAADKAMSSITNGLKSVVGAFRK